MNKLKISLLLVTAMLLLALPVGALKGESNASVAFTPGTINFLEAPTIHFGSHQLAGKTANYPAKTVVDVAMISDARGSMTGWALKINLSTFAESGVPTLRGSSLILAPVAPQPINSHGVPPTGFPASVELMSGDSINHLLLTAKNGEGSGIWGLSLPPENINLRIPGGVGKPGVYKATIQWTLVDAPDA